MIKLIVISILTTPLWAQTIIHGSGQGQSNCTGAGTAAVITDSQPWSNLGFQPAVIPPTSGSTVSLHNNLYSSSAAEWPGISMANEITYLSSGKSTRVLIDSFDCSAGATYAQLAKGSTQYNTHWLPMFSSGGVPSPVAKNVIQSAPFSLTYQFGFFYNIHGEADFGTLNASQYAADIEQWRSDMTSDVNAGNSTSGSSYPVFLHQFAAWNVCTGSCGIANASAPTMDGTVGGTPSTPVGQWQSAHDYPAGIILSPGYQFTFNSSLSVHYDAYGYIGIGSLMGKQYSDWVANPRRVLYVTPRSVKIVGSTVVVQFWVPTGHLVFDTTTLPAVTAANGQTACYGLEWDNDSNAVTCSSAALSGTGSADGGNDTVTLTLSGAPGTGGVLRSGWTGTAGTQPGGVSGAYSHTNIRDTDTRIAWCADPTVNLCPSIPAQDKNLYDWAVSFQISSFPYAFDPFAVDAKDTVTIYETDGVTRSNIPVVLGRGAKQGDYVANTCPRPEISGSPLANWQYDAKNAWSDGSAKFGIRSFVIASLPANSSVTVTFVPDACPSSVPLTQAQMTGFNSGSWGAQIQVTANGTTVTSDAATMLARYDPATSAQPGTSGWPDCKNDYWLKGPVVTAVIIQDCILGTGAGATRHWDFGWPWSGTAMGVAHNCIADDCSVAGNPNSLHPWFVCYFYPTTGGSGGNYSKCDYVLENDWVTTPQNQAINVDYYVCSGASGCATTATKVLGYDGVPRITPANITFTANSGSITCSSGCNFTSADVGSSISIGSSAPAVGGTFIDTTICSVSSATAARLCDNPAGLTSGAMYTVQAAINIWYFQQNYRKTFWSGAGSATGATDPRNPGDYLVDHNWSYMVTTGLIPPYDQNCGGSGSPCSASPDSQILSRSDDCNSSPSTGTDFKCMAIYNTTGAGFGPDTWSDMGDRGGIGRTDPSFGAADGDPTPMSREALLYLTNMGTAGTAGGAASKAWLMLTGQYGQRAGDVALVTGSCAGQSVCPATANSAALTFPAFVGGSGMFNNSGNIPFHLRESRPVASLDQASYFCPNLAAGQYANTTSTTGNNVLMNSAVCGTGAGTVFGRTFSRYADQTFGPASNCGYTPTGAQCANNNFGHWGLAAIRWLEWTYVGYLMSGDYYYLSETQMNAAWSSAIISIGSADYDSPKFFGFANASEGALRQSAGLLDAIQKGWVASPDGTLDQEYFDSILASNAEVVEGMMGITGTALTPTTTNTTCATYNYQAANRWDWGHCTVVSGCGNAADQTEPQDQTSCQPLTPTLHQYGWRQTYVANGDVNGTLRSASAGYAEAGTSTVLHEWSSLVPGCASCSVQVGTTITISGALAPWTALNGNVTVTAVGTTTLNCGPKLSTCKTYTVNVDTHTLTSANLGATVTIQWGGFGLISGISVGTNATITTSTLNINSVTAGSSLPGSFAIFGCVDQAGGTQPNWSTLNGMYTLLATATANQVNVGNGYTESGTGDTAFTGPFNSTGFPAFSQSGCYIAQIGQAEQSASEFVQGWMEGLLDIAVNEAFRKGSTYFGSIATAVQERQIEKVLDPSNNLFQTPALNFQPATNSAGATSPLVYGFTPNPFLGTGQTVSQGWAAFASKIAPVCLKRVNTFWTSSPQTTHVYTTACVADGGPCGSLSDDHRYALVGRAALVYGYGVTDTTDGNLSGTTAWNNFNASYPYFNNTPANGDQNCSQAGTPDVQIKFAFAPLSSAPPVSPSGTPSVSPANTVRSGSMVATMRH